MSEAAENHYGRVAYQRTAEIESRVSDGLTLEERYQREADFALRASGLKIGKGDSILDLACGAGGHAFAMSEKTGADIDARDISEPLLEQGRARQQRESLTKAVRGNVHFAVGNTVDIKPSIDAGKKYKLVTILGNSFIVPPTKEANQQALNNIYCVIEPGGRLVIQMRPRKRNYDTRAQEAWMQQLGVKKSVRRADGPDGKFGRFAESGKELTVLEDTKVGDGFYWYDEVDGSRDADGIRKLHFSRVYFDKDGNEEAFPPAEFLDYLDVKAFPALKKMLDAAGFKSIRTQEEPLSSDGAKAMFAVIAEK